MRERRGTVLVWIWIVAGLAVIVVARVSHKWKSGSPPLWWWILGAAVLAPGIPFILRRNRERDYEERWVCWWRGLPPALRPVGILATVVQLVLFGLAWPAVGVFFLVEGNLGGKLIGAGLLGLSLLSLVVLFRRGK